MNDAVVVGAGVAGLAAAIHLARAGMRVRVLAKGVGATHLAGATVDVLGYAPALVGSPTEALPGFVARHPDHPYAHLGPDAVVEAVRWFRELVADLGYAGDPDRNLLLPTALGVPRPTALAPATMAGGDLAAAGPLLVVGIRALKDLHPRLLAENLRLAGFEARAVEVDLEGLPADLQSVALARRLEDAEVRKAFLRSLEGEAREGERVLVPAVLGLEAWSAVWEELQDALGAPVVEVPTLPPSVAGVRLARTLRAALREAGGRLWMGAEAFGAEASGDRVEAILTRTGGRVVRHEARWFVLATGGVAAGGVAADARGAFRETVLGLPLRWVPADGPAFLPRYLDEHPASRVGVAVDGEMRPLGPDGAPALDNVVAAGAVIGGAEPWREKSGEGISVATAHRAARTVLGEAGG